MLRLAYFKTQLPPKLAHLEVAPEYYVWLCIDKADGWAHEFLIAYTLYSPRMILSNTWSPGFRHERGWYQKVHIDSKFLEHGNVSVDVMFDSKTSSEMRGAGVDLGRLLSGDGTEKYAISREEAFFRTSSPCDQAKRLDDKHITRSQGAQIDS